MFAFIASQVLGSVAECGNCASRGKSNVLPQYAMPTTKKASSLDRRTESCVVYYPEDIDGSPLKSRRESFPLNEVTDQEDPIALYNAELSRCSAELAKELKRERRRLAGPPDTLSSVEQSSSHNMRMRHRRTMDNLRSQTKDLATGSCTQSAPTFVAAVKTPHMMRARCETDASVESDASPTRTLGAGDAGEAIDALYEFGEVSKRLESIRHMMPKTDPIPGIFKPSGFSDGQAGTTRHSRFAQQQQEQQRIKAEIENFQGILGKKLESLGGKHVDGVQPVGQFRKTEDPAEAVRDGVLKYHKRCSQLFENNMSTRQFYMLEGFKKDLAEPTF